jgi:hypothetical protein
MGHFCPPGSGSTDLIESGSNTYPDPKNTKYKIIKIIFISAKIFFYVQLIIRRKAYSVLIHAFWFRRSGRVDSSPPGRGERMRESAQRRGRTRSASTRSRSTSARRTTRYENDLQTHSFNGVRDPDPYPRFNGVA